MADKKPKLKKPKGYGRLSQKEKFIAAAKAADADETGETFAAAIKKIVKSPQKRG
ncbi:MAG TPA: hypothetical protein VFI23_00130 [Rhizomicrobium sp.]|nr:hypothetical protein [Rhizomicrobium sp.]